MKVGELIRQFREENNISQREFSRRSGISNSNVSIIEAGFNNQTGKPPKLTYETYLRIAKAMGISTTALFLQIDDEIDFDTIGELKLPERHQRLLEASQDLTDEELDVAIKMIKLIRGKNR